jgi:hypothetical protein
MTNMANFAPAQWPIFVRILVLSHDGVQESVAQALLGTTPGLEANWNPEHKSTPHAGEGRR